MANPLFSEDGDNAAPPYEFTSQYTTPPYTAQANPSETPPPYSTDTTANGGATATGPSDDFTPPPVTPQDHMTY